MRGERRDEACEPVFTAELVIHPTMIDDVVAVRAAVRSL
jgi:hypothetical protein